MYKEVLVLVYRIYLNFRAIDGFSSNGRDPQADMEQSWETNHK